MNRFICIQILFCIFIPLNSLYAADELEVKILKSSVNNRTLSIGHLVKEISDRRIIYIGEMHDNEIHHKVQKEIVSELYSTDSKIAIGMEMFHNESQDYLDLYLLGVIDEDEFLQRIDYNSGWGFDFTLYKPLLEFAKVHKIRVIALNTSPGVIRKVSNIGIAGLDAETLNMLPGFIDFTNDKYRNFLMDIYKKHPHTNSGDFNRFYEIQLIWDESMAEIIDDFLNNNQDTRLIVITGNGHLVYNYGIPSRVYRRNKLSYITIVQDIEDDHGVSDYIVKTPEHN